MKSSGGALGIAHAGFSACWPRSLARSQSAHPPPRRRAPAPRRRAVLHLRVPITVNGYEVLQDTRSAAAPPGPADGHITKMETDIVDAGGDPVPISRLMLHHIVFLNIGTLGPDLLATSPAGTAPRGLPAARALLRRRRGAGEDVAARGLRLPAQAPGQPWGLLYMVMNHRASPTTPSSSTRDRRHSARRRREALLDGHQQLPRRPLLQRARDGQAGPTKR